MGYDVDEKASQHAYERLPLTPSDVKGPITWRSPRKGSAFLPLVGLVCLVVGVSYLYFAHEKPVVAQDIETCSPLSYDSGTWVQRRTLIPHLETLDDVYASFGVSSCRAQFQPTWNLGLGSSFPPYDDYARKTNYDWEPHSSCHLRPLSIKSKLQMLIDRPLLLAGDSRSRQHFFALSCELADHVIWRGEAPVGDDNSDIRAWRFAHQHLLLDVDSDVWSKLRLPSSFDSEKPLVTFVMAYLPISREEMRTLSGPGIYKEHVPDSAPVPAYPVSELSMNETIDVFVDSHYKTMIHSTGAHFGPVFFRNGAQIHNALAVLRASLKLYYGELARRMTPDQRVLVRAAEAGQTDCDAYTMPLPELDSVGNAFNYGFLDELNGVLESESRLTGDSRFSWLGLSRLTRLRPDAHLPGDCVHFVVGSGVYEAISRYMWHAISAFQ